MATQVRSYLANLQVGDQREMRPNEPLKATQDTCVTTKNWMVSLH